jgi:hypothetical protein
LLVRNYKVAIFCTFFSDRFLGFWVRPFAGFTGPGYSYLPNPTTAVATTPGTPAASGPELGSTYYDYAAAAHQQQQQQQPPATARPEQTVNNSPLHRHHSDPHATAYRTANTAMQRKHCSGAAPPRSNQHQQMMLHSEVYASGGEDHGVKAYVTGMCLGCPHHIVIIVSSYCGLCHWIETAHFAVSYKYRNDLNRFPREVIETISERKIDTGFDYAPENLVDTLQLHLSRQGQEPSNFLPTAV